MQKHLMIVFEQPLRFVLLDVVPDSSFVFELKSFSSVAWDGLFYDWLYDHSGKLIGVRECESPPATLVPSLSTHPDVKLEDGSFLVFFGNNRDFDLDADCSQDFGTNQFFQSSTGVIALILDLFNLSPAEVKTFTATSNSPMAV